jgi:hypothetical protein
LGLREQVVAWRVEPLPAQYRDDKTHLSQVERLSDGYHVSLGEEDALVVYLLEIRQAEQFHDGSAEKPPWEETS